MGLLTDFVIKDEKTKKYLAWAKDIIILGIFIYLAFGYRNAWQAGYDYCAKDACLVCMGEIETDISTLELPNTVIQNPISNNP